MELVKVGMRIGTDELKGVHNMTAMFITLGSLIIEKGITVPPSKGVESKQISVRLPKDMHTELCKIAEMNKISIQEVLRLGLDQINL